MLIRSGYDFFLVPRVGVLMFFKVDLKFFMLFLHFVIFSG